MSGGRAAWVDEDRTVEIPISGARRRSVGRSLGILALVGTVATVVLVLVSSAGDPPALTASGSTVAPADASSPFLTQAPTSTARPTTTSSAQGSPCTGPRAFAAAVARVDPTFTTQRGFSGYEMKGCSDGVALAWGVKGEEDATWVALFPRRGGYDLEDWATGDPCPDGRDMPADLAENACADAGPALTSSPATTSSPTPTSSTAPTATGTSTTPALSGP